VTTSLLSRLSLAFITIPLFAQDAVDIALSITQIPTEYNERLPPYTLDDGLWAFDCSGLVQYSYLNASNSLTLPRTAADQSQIGTVVGPPYQRGDLMFFATLKPGEVGHVGIVVDADMMIDANSYDGKVEQESYIQHIGDLCSYLPNACRRITHHLRCLQLAQSLCRLH